jgi:hypothetical protein
MTADLRIGGEAAAVITSIMQRFDVCLNEQLTDPEV